MRRGARFLDFYKESKSKKKNSGEGKRERERERGTTAVQNYFEIHA